MGGSAAKALAHQTDLVGKSFKEAVRCQVASHDYHLGESFS
jgi:hypothetical protein